MNESVSQYTVGMDIGDQSISICVLNSAGGIDRRTTIATRKESIVLFFKTLAPPEVVTIAIEAGSHSPWVSHLLSNLGFRILVANARALRFIWGVDNKTDALDAERLARVARFDPELLHPIQHRGQEAHIDLATIKARDVLVRSRVALINHVRGTCKAVGIHLRKCSTATFTKMIFTEAFLGGLQEAIVPILESIDKISDQIRELERQIKILSRQKYPETQKLEQVTGVGAVTALAFVLTLEDPYRFKKSRDVGPYLGLIPKKDQSGLLDKPLAITKSGNKYLRRLLVGSANYIMGSFGPDCDLRRYGDRIANRGSTIARRKAKVAVARKLSVLLHRLWITDDEYRPLMKQKAA